MAKGYNYGNRLRTLAIAAYSCLWLSTEGVGQNVEIAYGSPGTYTYASNKKTQILFPKQELLSKGAPAGGGLITEIGFSISAVSGSLNNYTLKLHNARNGLVNYFPATGVFNPLVPVVDYSITGNVLTVNSITPASFKIDAGQVLFDLGQITSPCCPYNYIVADGSGSGGTGTYTLAYAQTGAGSTTIFQNINNTVAGFHPGVFTTVKNPFSYSPSVTTVSDYDLITLDTPFNWDGNSDLLLEVCYSTGTAPQIRGLNPISSLRRASDCASDPSGTNSGNNVRPMTRFVFSCVSPVQPPEIQHR